MWNSLDECDDMWEHLFSAMVTDKDIGKVLYWGGHRRAYYKDNFCVEWVDSFKHLKTSYAPDVIVARGGFNEYIPLLKMFPDAKKIYYGANHGCVPKDGIAYHSILVDSAEQIKKVEAAGMRPVLFTKPAPPMFEPVAVEKKYDVCFVATHPADKRKNVRWVYKTCPKDLSVLQLGNAPKFKVPDNFTVKKVEHDKMPKAISKCKVLVAPYTSEDSGPRVLSEALACNVRAVVLDSVQTTLKQFVASKKDFWGVVKDALILYKNDSGSGHIRGWYMENCSIPIAAQWIKGNILAR